MTFAVPALFVLFGIVVLISILFDLYKFRVINPFKGNLFVGSDLDEYIRAHEETCVSSRLGTLARRD